MKVKVISRNPDNILRQTKLDRHKLPRNYDKDLHPFEAAREYTRALNATKLERVFAKPFIGSLDGHRDSVSVIEKHPQQLSTLVSGAYDGEIRVWDITTRNCSRSFVAHEGIVRGIAYVPEGNRFISIGDDKNIKVWDNLKPQWGEQEEPINTILSKNIITGITHHRKDKLFATCGEICQVWDETRNEPVITYQWGVDSLHDVTFNLVETNLLLSCASDRSIILYDIRDTGPIHKVTLSLRSNKACWNPMEAYIFTCANEDYNLYSYDVRNFKMPINIHKDHVSAVTYVDYSPTGREFVSGSYDKSIRIYELHKGHSREIYHTKRMQRLTSVKWSFDNRYIMSASDEMNVRIWKARAAEKLGVLKPREKNALNYSEALKEKYANHPQIRRIARHRQIPKHIYNAQAELRDIQNKLKKKEANRRAHSKKGAVPYIPARKKVLVREHK